jgi:hypothetical protein
MWAEPSPETLAALRETLLGSEEMLEARGEGAGIGRAEGR